MARVPSPDLKRRADRKLGLVDVEFYVFATPNRDIGLRAAPTSLLAWGGERKSLLPVPTDWCAERVDTRRSR